MTSKFFRKWLPKPVYERIRSAIVFAPEDPNNLVQVLPQRVVTVNVPSIKGYRYPAPGSSIGAKIPIRTNEDHLFDTDHYSRDYRNLPNGEIIEINGKKKHVTVDTGRPHLPSHGKRKISLLPYDPSGLRSTKTTTWEAVDKSLEKNRIRPDHLPTCDWEEHIEYFRHDFESKGLPPPIGAHVSPNTPKNYYQVGW